MDEAQVIARVRSGATDAFAAIVEYHQIPIIRYLCRLTGDIEVAKDMAQETFIRAYQGIIRTQADFSFKAWLYRIATNIARDFHRRRRLISFIPFLEAGRSDNPSERDFSDRVIDTLATEEALCKVPHDQRVCMVLHYVEGFRYREIGDIVGASEEAVRKRVARGSHAFREAYRSVIGGDEV